MRSEDLDQRDLERWDLAVHEASSQVELDLETNVDLWKESVVHKMYWETRRTFALLIVGDHHMVKRRLGICERPDRCAVKFKQSVRRRRHYVVGNAPFVSFLYFIDSSKPPEIARWSADDQEAAS